MGELSETGYILHAVTRSLTRTEPAGTDIDCIGPVLYRFNAALQILGGRQKFQTPTLFHITRYEPCSRVQYT